MWVSPLRDHQVKLDATFAKYGDRELPQHFAGVEDEYAAATGTVALMDRSHYGKLRVSGYDHVDLLHRLTTNELRTLQPGEGQINILPNEKGRIVERFALYKHEDRMELITSPDTPKKVTDWIDRFTFIEDVKIEELTHNLGMVTLFGGRADALIAERFNLDVKDLPDRHHRHVSWEGTDLTVAATHELGVPGYDLLIDLNHLPVLWDALIAARASFELQPMGEAAYEILRIESGWPLYERDYSDKVNPHEAGMRPYISFTKGCYVGQEVIARLDTYDKVQKHLLGLIFEGTTPAEPGDAIVIDDTTVGHITSTTSSLALKKPVALGYVRTKFIEEGAQGNVRSASGEHTAILRHLPLVARPLGAPAQAAGG